MDIALKKRIMQRVYAVYLMRKATSPVALQTYLLSFLTLQLFLFVSMRHVVENAPGILNVAAFARFYAQSFLQTEPVVQVLAVGVLSVTSWMARGIVRNMKQGSVIVRTIRTQRAG